MEVMKFTNNGRGFHAHYFLRPLRMEGSAFIWDYVIEGRRATEACPQQYFTQDRIISLLS